MLRSHSGGFGNRVLNCNVVRISARAVNRRSTVRVFWSLWGSREGHNNSQHYKASGLESVRLPDMRSTVREASTRGQLHEGDGTMGSPDAPQPPSAASPPFDQPLASWHAPTQSVDNIAMHTQDGGGSSWFPGDVVSTVSRWFSGGDDGAAVESASPAHSTMNEISSFKARSKQRRMRHAERAAQQVEGQEDIGADSYEASHTGVSWSSWLPAQQQQQQTHSSVVQVEEPPIVITIERRHVRAGVGAAAALLAVWVVLSALRGRWRKRQEKRQAAEAAERLVSRRRLLDQKNRFMSALSYEVDPSLETAAQAVGNPDIEDDDDYEEQGEWVSDPHGIIDPAKWDEDTRKRWQEFVKGSGINKTREWWDLEYEKTNEPVPDVWIDLNK